MWQCRKRVHAGMATLAACVIFGSDAVSVLGGPPMNAVPRPQALPAHGSRLAALNDWVADVAALTKPQAIHWCDGSDDEYARLLADMVADGTLLPLNPQTHPGCYLHRSDPDDVARVEHLTFVCTRERDDAGPNNHWMSPAEAHAKMDALFDGCMRGRTLYVVPYCMGPIDSPLARCGVEITDSPYVVANMRLMTRMGAAALARLERESVHGKAFVRGQQ
jgi:phosphoenolpyruvate carboxykinase (GTP)